MSYISGTTTRLSGLASSIDTDMVVEELMKASEIKVDEVRQQKQILEWKQEFYQEVTKKLYDFQQKYFSDASWSESISKPAPSYNSNYISVTTSANSVSGNIYIKDIVSVATAAKLTGTSAVSSDPVIDIDTSNLSELAGKNIIISLNGTEEQLNFSDISYESSADVQTELQSLINSKFGSDKIMVSLNEDRLTLSAENSEIILKIPTDGSDASSVLTYDAFSSNRVDLNVSLSSADLRGAIPAGSDIEFVINGKTFNFTSDDTLSQIMNKINTSDAGVKMTYSSLTDKFTITSVKTGSASDITFSDTTGTLMSSLFGTGITTYGTDAVVKLSTSGATDGSDIITITRSNNSIDVDGTTITLKGKAPGEAEEGISVLLSHNSDDMFNKITAFVDDYNALLSSITAKTSEEYDRDYPPLTDAQRADMSEKEIEDWEKKAKTGLLANDIYLNDIATSLRSCMYTPLAKLGDNTEALGVLIDLGISTVHYSDKGKLTIDKTKLRNALNSDPDKAAALFSQKSSISFSLYASQEQQEKRFNESGIFYRFSDILNKNLSTVGKKGALIS
ncbi:MAG TPA: hypothetical protein DD733_12640, partial [Clostridiales bacterium]|nr:hypothetical protein [Clostridiales bacterium]